jgi:Protein of unknown function (DUF2721)
MDPASLAQSPFAVLSFIAAPAVLTNATSTLVTSTTTRWLETRKAMKRSLAKSQKPGIPEQEAAGNRDHGGRLETQATMLLGALRLIYIALGAFASATLVTLVGAALVPFHEALWYYSLALLGVVLGAVGVGCLIFSSILLFQTTQISLTDIRDDAKVIRERHVKL